MPGHRTSARPPPQERTDEKIHKRQNDRRADGTEKEHAGGEILDRPQDDQKLAARQRILGHEIHAAEQLTAAGHAVDPDDRARLDRCLQ